MNKSPCLDCPDRHPGCHSTCDKYQQFKQKKEEERKNRRVSREYDAYMKDYHPKGGGK